MDPNLIQYFVTKKQEFHFWLWHLNDDINDDDDIDSFGSLILLVLLLATLLGGYDCNKSSVKYSSVPDKNWPLINDEANQMQVNFFFFCTPRQLSHSLPVYELNPLPYRVYLSNRDNKEVWSKWIWALNWW